MTLRQLILTLIPYTTLFRSLWTWSKPLLKKKGATAGGALPGLICLKGGDLADRKSTRLNSSHLVISYAFFCLTITILRLQETIITHSLMNARALLTHRCSVW